MNIRTRLCVSLDGNVTTPDGWPVQLADPSFGIPDTESEDIPEHVTHYGFPEFQRTCDAALMGRVTFEPALAASRWPWPGLDVFVLGSKRPHGTPEEVVFDDDPQRLLEKVRSANRGGDVHLVGGPQTIETFRAIGALDKLGLLVIPFLTGEGMRLTPAVSQESRWILEGQRALKGGVLEVTYSAAPGSASNP